MRQMPSVRICHVGAIVQFDRKAHARRRPAGCGAPSSDDAGVAVPDDGDVRSLAIHPASTTHSQGGDADLRADLGGRLAAVLED